VLGYVNPAYLAGGSVPIDAARARQAIAEQVAGPLDLPLLEAAWAAHVVANAHMIGALKAVSTQRGRDPRAFTLVAFGGNGPVHAAGMAQLLEMRQIIVPPTPGLFSAVGLLHADHEHHAVQTYYRPFAEVAVADLQARLDALAREALAELTAEGHAPDQVRLHWTVDLRYIGQGFELTVPLPDGPIGSATLAGLAEIFHTEHARTYGHRATDPIQFVNLRLTARGPRPPAAPARAESNGHAPAPPLPARLAYFGAAGQQLTPVVRRADLSAAPRSGPFIVEEYDATTVVPPGWTGRIDVHGNIIIEVEA
jgi:N-methylhydantoinase A